MTQVTPEATARMARNIQDREYAWEVIGMCGEQSQRFWEVLIEMAIKKLPPKPAPVEGDPPMTDQEAIHFEAKVLPYGKYHGQSVGECRESYLLFLVEGDEFSKGLRRYVKSRRFYERQEDGE